MNFLIIELCDNDFGHSLRDGLEYLELEWGVQNYCPTIIKRYLIQYIKLKDILRGDRDSSDYLEERMKVYYSAKMPTYDIEGENPMDHDGGSVWMNLHNKQMGTF